MVKSIIHYDDKTDTVYVSILKPFFTAGTRFGWKTQVGFGIEKKAIQIVLEKHAMLCCYLGDSNKQNMNWCSYKKVLEFLHNNHCMGTNNNRPLVYLPVDLFSAIRPTTPYAKQEILF